MSDLTIVAVVTVHEGTEDEMRGVLASLVTPSRKDEGNLRYEFYADEADPRRFVFVERWTDSTAHFRHDQQSEHITTFTSNHGHKLEKVDLYRIQEIG